MPRFNDEGAITAVIRAHELCRGERMLTKVESTTKRLPTEAALLHRLSGVRQSIAGFAVEGLTKFQANDLEARWNSFHAKIISSLFGLRKTG